MGKYVCGIDIGTTGVKVMIFDLEGNVISSDYTEYLCTLQSKRVTGGLVNDV